MGEKQMLRQENDRSDDLRADETTDELTTGQQ